jgi:sugar phosphate permease
MSQPPDAAPAAWAERPTWVRWRLVALLMAYSFMTWFNRVSMTVAANDRILKDEPISPTEMGLVYSAFLAAYALFMTPGGWFIDRFGARTALLVMGFGSAAFGALTGLPGYLGLSAGALLGSLLVIRALMGLFTAPVYPASSRTVAHWLPLPQRAGANGFVQGSASLGIACTFPVFGALVHWGGWPQAFIITAAVTAGLALLWALYATDRPEQHPGVNKAELALIVGRAQPAAAGAGRHAVRWGLLLRNRSLALLTLSYAAVGYFEYLFFFWMDYYFKDVLVLEADAARFYSSIPPLAMTVGMPLGGWLSDRLQRAVGYRGGRAVVCVGGMLAGAGFLGFGIQAKEPVWIVTWFALALAAVGACEGPVWATAVELGGRAGGTAAGICNTGGNVGGILAPVVTPWFSGRFGWQAGISLGSGVCLLGALLWWWIDLAEPMLEDPAAAAATEPATRDG